jgi:hypothetical protein
VNISEEAEFVDIDDIMPDNLAENLANALEEAEFLDIDDILAGVDIDPFRRQDATLTPTAELLRPEDHPTTMTLAVTPPTAAPHAAVSRTTAPPIATPPTAAPPTAAPPTTPPTIVPNARKRGRPKGAKDRGPRIRKKRQPRTAETGTGSL